MEKFFTHCRMINMRPLKKTVLLLIMIIMGMNVYAQPFTLALWPDGKIPNYQPSDDREIVENNEIMVVRMVQNPDITVYLPSRRNATGQAVIICPGGGYWILAYDWEGSDIAKWFNANGIAAIVLKYRLPVSKSNVIPHKSPLIDAQRAMRMVRHNAAAWQIDPGKIGIMGFSAGGHLASTLSTHYDAGDPNSSDPVDRQSCRPDFSILMYPVVSFNTAITHGGSRNALLGENPDEDLIRYYSNELQVTDDTPPAILIHAADDQAVPVENSIAYFKALREKNIPAEMHIYPYGGHGYSLAIGQGYLSTWPQRVMDWMKTMGK